MDHGPDKDDEAAPSTSGPEEPPSSSYKVGYGMPPIHSQFKKGHSGNPRGRRRNRRSIREEVEDALNKGVTINEHGRSRKISTREALFQVLRTKAIGGDLKAIDKLLSLAAQYAPSDLPQDVKSVLEEDKKLIEAFRKRLMDGGGDVSE